jgi:hypothetical protein
MKRRTSIAAAILLPLQLPVMAGAIPVELYKNPNCFCCDLYARHLEQNGFTVHLINTTDMDAVKQKYAIPEKLEGCHTAIVQGYVVEGLVPAQFVQRLLKERPAGIKGISLPGMPVGAPGMEGAKSKQLQVYALQRSPSGMPPVYGEF